MTATATTSGRFASICVPLETPLPWTPGVCPFTVTDGLGATLRTDWSPVTFDSKGDVAVAQVTALTSGEGTHYLTVETAEEPSQQTGWPSTPGRAVIAAITGADFRLHVGSTAVPIFDYPTKRAARAVSVERRSVNSSVTRFAGQIGELGFVAFATTWHGFDGIVLDLVVHNGHAEADRRDQTVQGINFSGLPEGWEITWTVPEPSYPWQAPVKFRPRAQRQMRLVLHAEDEAAQARLFASFKHYGIPSRAWQSTQRWFPQGVATPKVDLAGLHSRVAADYQQRRQALIEEQLMPSYMQSKGAGDGFFTPHGSEYGGMTGGEGIYGQHGALEVADGSPESVGTILLEQRMVTDRMFSALVDSHGAPSAFESGSDTHTDQGLPIDGYMSVDWQHRIRHTKNCIAGAYLTNDPLSRWAVELEAANGARSWSPWSYMGEWKPAGQGAWIGRAEWWAAHVVCAGEQMRPGSHLTWVRAFVDACAHIQMQAGTNGHLEAKNSGKIVLLVPPNTGEDIHQNFEECFAGDALAAAIRCGVEKARGVLSRLVFSLMHYDWAPGAQHPRAATAARVFGSEQLFESWAQVKAAGAHSEKGMKFYIGNAMALGYLHDPSLRADVLERLERMGTSASPTKFTAFVHDSAAIALLQAPGNWQEVK